MIGHMISRILLSSAFILLSGLFTSLGLAGEVTDSPSLEKNTKAALPHKVLRLPNVHPGRDPVYAYAKTLLSKAQEVTEDKYGLSLIHI